MARSPRLPPGPGRARGDARRGWMALSKPSGPWTSWTAPECAGGMRRPRLKRRWWSRTRARRREGGSPCAALVRDELEQIGLRDDRHRAVFGGREQRGGAGGELGVEALDVLGGLNHRERGLHHALDLLLDQCRVAEDAVEHRPLLNAADDVADAPRLAVLDDRDLRDAVSLHRLDRRTHGLSFRYDDEPGSPFAVLHDVEHGRVHRIALEIAVLTHPLVVVDLREVRASGIREEHDDDRVAIELLRDLERREHRGPR